MVPTVPTINLKFGSKADTIDKTRRSESQNYERKNHE